jgi:hypothetical protein
VPARRAQAGLAVPARRAQAGLAVPAVRGGLNTGLQKRFTLLQAAGVGRAFALHYNLLRKKRAFRSNLLRFACKFRFNRLRG